jgi:hypothetical protein
VYCPVEGASTHRMIGANMNAQVGEWWERGSGEGVWCRAWDGWTVRGARTGDCPGSSSPDSSHQGMAGSMLAG